MIVVIARIVHRPSAQASCLPGTVCRACHCSILRQLVRNQQAKALVGMTGHDDLGASVVAEMKPILITLAPKLQVPS